MSSSPGVAMTDVAKLLFRRQVDQSKDSNIGSAQNSSKQPSSASTVLSTLAPVALFALVWFIIFLIFRKVFPRRYSPRSFLGSLREQERSPRMPSGLLSWFGKFFSISDTHVLNHHSLDGYLLLRLLKMAVISCLVGCLITWPILFPVNITGGGGQKELNRLSFSNVRNNYYRYLAHAGCAYLFFGYIIVMITRESIFFVNLRQAYLMSPLYAKRISSRTVLFTAVPKDYMSVPKLRSVLGEHVKRIWLPTDTNELEDMVEERDKAAFKLEAAETQLIKSANAARLKAVKKGASRPEDAEGITGDGAESGSVAGRWLTQKQRPTHRLKPIIGKKVDTINWARAELPKLIPKVEAEQHKHRIGEANLLSSVFVEFDTLPEAQAAYQSLTHHQVLHMAPRYTGMVPQEIIWSNLRIFWWEKVVRFAATTGITVALIIFWSIPVAFVAAFSNITALIDTFPWLGFLNSIPSQIIGLVTGLLPAVLLAVLISLVPIILRLLARLGGDPTLSAVELTVQNSYFAFQVVQVFLVATLGSAASATVERIIEDPTSVTDVLSTQIPKASNFYLAYFILQGLGVFSSLLLGLVGLIIFKVLYILFDKTPRKMYKRWTRLAGLGLGTVFPIYTNLFVIAICYACIAPLVLGFAAIGLYLFYFVYRYNMLFVYNIDVDTKGLVYPRALQHLFVGLYIAELCLIGLFAVKASEVGSLIALILMILLLVFTAVYHISLNAALRPLLNYLPKSLVAEERHLLEVENGASKEAAPVQHKKPNFLMKFLKPHIYSDYHTLRRLVPSDFSHISYDETVAHDAYFHPAVTSRTPLLWIPRDPMGVSRQEVQETSKVIPITDEGAHLDEKNKIIWDAEGARPPIYEPKIYY